jgi:hypothetical protein
MVDMSPGGMIVDWV